MKKSIEKPFFTPHPVLIIGTYDANGVPNAMNAAWGGQNRAVGDSLGPVRSIGRRFE